MSSLYIMRQPWGGAFDFCGGVESFQGWKEKFPSLEIYFSSGGNVWKGEGRTDVCPHCGGYETGWSGEALPLTAEEEADVLCQGGEPAVPTSHDAKPLKERGAVVACGDPFVEVVDEIVVDAVLALDGVDDFDAPVVVCRVAIAQVVEWRERASWYEGLVADEHTIGKGALRQQVRWAQPTRVEVLVSSVHNHRVAIEEVWSVCLECGADGADGVGCA